jgi:hypothetical protein
MNEQDLRDCFAMFAINGLVARTISGFETIDLASQAYAIADSMLEARKPQETVGLPAIKKRVRK